MYRGVRMTACLHLQVFKENLNILKNYILSREWKPGRPSSDTSPTAGQSDLHATVRDVCNCRLLFLSHKRQQRPPLPPAPHTPTENHEAASHRSETREL